MRRFLPTLLALVLLAGLAVATVLSAHSTDRGALGNAAAIGPLPSNPVNPPAPVSCSIAPQSGSSTLSVQATGACTGTFSGAVECNGDDDALDASAQATLTNGLHLTLSVIVPDPGNGAGHYDDIALYAQVNRQGEAERWSNRDSTLTMDAHGTMTIAATLNAELATGTPGRLTLRGTIRCRNPLPE